MFAAPCRFKGRSGHSELMISGMRFYCLQLYSVSVAVVLALSTRGALAEVTVSGAVARPSPEWLRNGTIYEIFPRDFSAAGNLEGVTAKLDDLHSLGVNILWTMPIHPIGKKFRKGDLGSPYSIKDYYAVDPNYGTLQDYQRLVSEAHKRGMKVIMDLVADHTAWDSVMMQHPEFYKHDAQGAIISPVPAWTDVAALNYDNPTLRRYMMQMLKYWVTTCNVDGFRCDAAAMVPTDFWVEARAELCQIKPDIILLAEASKPELLTNAFDIDYSWPLLSVMDEVISNQVPASKIRLSWEESVARFPKGALHMRISDDHDEARAISRYGFEAALAASALMFTLDGVPLIYNGMEAADTTRSDGDALFDKHNLSWQSTGHPMLQNTYHDLIQLRREYAALCTSRVVWLHNSDESHLVTFLRADDKDELLVVINFADHPLTGRVDIENADRFVPVDISGVPRRENSALPAIQLNQYEWHIYHRSAKLIRPVADKN